MDVDIEYETLCVNCKEKGYSFGLNFKTIEFHGTTVLDIPTRYLNGPCLAFRYQNIPILLRSLENAHQNDDSTTQPIFYMINAKTNPSNTVSRFTYLYELQGHSGIPRAPTGQHPQIYEYVDIYRFPDRTYILLYYSFRNSTPFPLTDINFYNFYDFDIYGQEGYKSDEGHLDTSQKVVYQFDTTQGEHQSIFAGMGSTSTNVPNRFECNSPQEMMISLDRLNLRNIEHPGPNECAVGLQWKLETIPPESVKTFPIMLVFGKSREEFFKNCDTARNHLEKKYADIARNIDLKPRQKIDPKLKKLAFSQADWCK